VEEPPAKADVERLRHHIYVMEGALARAVELGAKTLNQQIREVAPDVFLLSGEARARGVYLEDYGVFFDVEVPTMRQSMMWSLRMMLDRDITGAQAAAGDLRRYLQGVTDPATRASLEAALRRLEQQAMSTGAMLRPPAQPAGQVGAAVQLPQSPAAPTPAPASTERAWVKDPNRAYTEAVQRALIDAMIDYSMPMVSTIGPNQWLTVAARDNEPRDTLAPQDPFEEVVTVLLRIKGSDLIEYRAGRIDQNEIRKRVRVSQF
jgi:hypothetical protein